MQVTADEVKNAMIVKGITQVDHHNCAGCGSMVEYFREGEQLFFDPRCDCNSLGHPEPRTWQEAADWINMQNAEVQVKLAASFGTDMALPQHANS